MPLAGCGRATLVACVLAAGGAHAQTSPGQSSPVGSSPPPSVQPASPTPPNPGATGLFAQPLLLGDVFGARPWLASGGITSGLEQTSEVLGNPTGGVRTGADYDGVLLASVGLDTSKAFGWSGGTINASGYWIQGRNLSNDDLYTVQTASGIEALRAVRLWELWFDQQFAGTHADVKIGQQSLDQEFITSTYSLLFINTTMGWPALPSTDLYAGGPAYPLSSLGVRLRDTFGPVTIQGGVFDDNPPGGSFFGDSQNRGAERTGTLLNLGGGALVIGEVLYAIKPQGLPGTYRLGGWFDSGSFPDQRYGSDGLSLADPQSHGIARLRRHDFSLYFSGDQEVWQGAGRSIGVFLRAMGAPDDRNALSFDANAGVAIKAAFTSRPNDTAGLGLGVVKFSQSASEIDVDRRVFTGDPSYPIRSSETFIELTYQVQVAPWWQVQPDFQYVWTPGGGLLAPNSMQRISNEAVFGVRTNVSF